MLRLQLSQSFRPLYSVVPGIFGNQLNYCVDVINQMLVRALESQHKEVGHVTSHDLDCIVVDWVWGDHMILGWVMWSHPYCNG